MVETIKTGGRHIYFAHTPGLRNRVKVISDCDLRTSGGYVVAPPSTNGNGKSYRWYDGLHMDSVKPPPMPSMLYDFLKAGATQFQNNDQDQGKHTAINTQTGGIMYLRVCVQGSETAPPRGWWAVILRKGCQMARSCRSSGNGTKIIHRHWT